MLLHLFGEPQEVASARATLAEARQIDRLRLRQTPERAGEWTLCALEKGTDRVLLEISDGEDTEVLDILADDLHDLGGPVVLFLSELDDEDLLDCDLEVEPHEPEPGSTIMAALAAPMEREEAPVQCYVLEIRGQGSRPAWRW